MQRFNATTESRTSGRSKPHWLITLVGRAIPHLSFEERAVIERAAVIDNLTCLPLLATFISNWLSPSSAQDAAAGHPTLALKTKEEKLAILRGLILAPFGNPEALQVRNIKITIHHRAQGLTGVGGVE